MKSIERLIESIILASRWLLVIFYLGLAIALAVYAFERGGASYESPTTTRLPTGSGRDWLQTRCHPMALWKASRVRILLGRRSCSTSNTVIPVPHI